jgi:3-oxoacyl-[acyl-carrier-protein] synthase III
MQPFVLNRHGRLVFPSNVFPELDFSVIRSQDQLDQVVRRDFEAKAPTGTEMLRRIEIDAYADRYQLMRDMALNLFWTNRFAATMYDKQPTRWGDVPRRRDDVFLPVLTPWEEGEHKVAAVESAFRTLPVAWDAQAEDQIFSVLFDVFRHRRHHATELPALKPTVAEALADPSNLTFHLLAYDPDYPRYGFDEILDARQDVPELEALHRWAMVLHNQYPWDRSQVRLIEVGRLKDDDYVILFRPRNREVARFLREARAGARPAGRRTATTTVETREPVRPYPAVHVATQFRVRPRIEALAVVKGERPCTNEDLIRNTSYTWSPMSVEEISTKTGIRQRLYTERDLEDIALEAARAALSHAGRESQEIGAVIVCSCTSTRMMPSVATWLSGELGMYQTHGSADVVAACAGLPYGLAEATRLLQEVERPVLVVCAEKFSDKIGNVRPSRMIFGDGAAAIVVAPAGQDQPTDIEWLQTYASGPVSEVNSIIWPNPAFDNNITVYGPEVRSLAGRYLSQMISELEALPDPEGAASSVWDTIELVVPHQANKTMVINLAEKAGLSADKLYFNIEQVGNTSAASIPLAIADAVDQHVIDRPTRVFAPGFGAGAVGGYAVLRVDPAIIASGAVIAGERTVTVPDRPVASDRPSEDVLVAFGD